MRVLAMVIFLTAMIFGFGGLLLLIDKGCDFIFGEEDNDNEENDK